MKKLAFLFLIYDSINCEEFWNGFFSGVDKNKYTIYIHYKQDKPLKYFEEYKLTNCIKTQYANISIVNAQNIILEEALKDENNEHFIFVSNSCIPFKTFEHIYNNLDISKSYFNIAPQIQCFPRCEDLLHFIDKKNIQKSSQWCILNRKHGKIMVDDKKYIKWYKNVYAPDEICYITNIFINNLQEEIIATPNCSDRATTFTNWEGMEYIFPSYRSLKTYKSITNDEIIHLMNSKCFFGRKFNRECIRDIINSDYIHLF